MTLIGYPGAPIQGGYPMQAPGGFSFPQQTQPYMMPQTVAGTSSGYGGSGGGGHYQSRSGYGGRGGYHHYGGGGYQPNHFHQKGSGGATMNL